MTSRSPFSFVLSLLGVAALLPAQQGSGASTPQGPKPQNPTTQEGPSFATVAVDLQQQLAAAVAELGARHPHERERIEAYHRRWLEMVAGPIEATVRLLEELDAQGVPLWALTNWSAETFALVRSDPTYAFLDRFREIFVSGDLRMIKPDPAIFRHTVETIGVPPASCLFIDDSAKNIAAAAAEGLLTHHFIASDQLRGDLERLGLLEGR